MKQIVKLIFAVVLMCAPAFVSAQTAGKSNEELSEYYKLQMKILQGEMKTLKSKMKLDPADTSLEKQMVQKKAEFSDVKKKKKKLLKK